MALVPSRQIDGREAETQRQVFQPFCQPELEGIRDGFGAIVVTFDLRSRIAQSSRKAQVLVFVVIVQPQIDRNSRGVVVGDGGIQQFERCSPGPAIGEQVTIADAGDHIFWGERTDGRARRVGFGHLSVSHVVHKGRAGVAFAKGSHILRSHPLRSIGVSHEGEAERAGGNAAQQGRIVQHSRGIIVDGRKVLAPQPGHMGRSGQA